MKRFTKLSCLVGRSSRSKTFFRTAPRAIAVCRAPYSTSKSNLKEEVPEAEYVQQDSYTSSESEAPDMKIDVLNKALLNVSIFGWSEEAIAHAVTDLGLPPLSHTIIERGAVEVVEHFLLKKNKHVFEFMTNYKDMSTSV